eukprot:GHVU01198653.1.p1 GENE.GHVU01198653.1~~GHVU01198653.1.p1  ORF type:complete len:191 (-),score=23.33 GHVU01198653.1:423-995(-)
MVDDQLDISNLRIEVRKKTPTSQAEMAELVVSMIPPERKGLIYCMSKHECEGVARMLRDKFSIAAQHYHGGMTPEDRDLVHKEWANNTIDVVVATVIYDFDDESTASNFIRFIYHDSIPDSVSRYLKQARRAGHDGKPSSVVIWYSPNDSARLRNLVSRSHEKVAAVNQMALFCENRLPVEVDVEAVRGA